MKIALMGSVSSSWHALDALIEHGVTVCCALGIAERLAPTISDYRSLRFRAEQAAIPYLHFEKVTEPAVTAFIQAHQPDQLWVIGLSQLVPPEIINLAPHRAVGFHPTLLPEGRGRAPVAWTILRQARAAVNLFYLAQEADAGDIIAQREVSVLPEDYAWELIERTNLVLREVIADLAPAIKTGTLTATPQNHALATYYERRTPADGLIDWRMSTADILRLIRAVGRPYAGAFTILPDGQCMTIWRAKAATQHAVTSLLSKDYDAIAPGTCAGIDGAHGMLWVTGDGALWVTEWSTSTDHSKLES